MSQRPPSPNPLPQRERAYGIGIDVGGTKIAAGLVNVMTGDVIDKRVLPTRPERGGQAVLDDVLSLAHDLLDTRHSAFDTCIGLGVCELVNARGEVKSDFTIAWKGVPVRERLSAIAPATVEADVRAHALAEARYGAGKHFETFVFVSLGTGISSCLVQGGVPFAGTRGNALVLATAPLTIVHDDGKRESQVLEEFASGPAIARRFGVARAEDVFAAAQAGDARATRVLTTAGEAIGNSIAFLTNVLDPEAIVIGGGLGVAGGVLWDSLVASTRAHIWSDETRTLPIVRAALGPDAGVVGAAAAAHIRTTAFA